MRDILPDIRYAIRLLVKQPGFSLVTIFVLALGIGATTAIFSVVDAVLLRPLPYANADRIVAVSSYWRKSGGRGQASAPDYLDWRDQSRSFAGLAAYQGGDSSVSVGPGADFAGVAGVSADFFPVMGARPVIGRLPNADEQRPGGPLTAVIGYAFWMSRFGGEPTAVGRTLKFREQPYAIVGVLPPDFRFPGRTDVWISLSVPPNASRSGHNYRVVGLLKPDVPVAQARAEMDGIGTRLEQAYPQSNGGKTVAVDHLRDQLVRNVRSTLNLILAVVVVVLLIACANVSNLLLARAATRMRELGIRAAVGATRSRMVRQLVTESVLLALVAGAAGVLIAAWGVRGLIALAPAGLPRLNEVHVDTRILAFAAAVSLISSFVFGLVPALQTSRVDLNDVLKQGGRNPATGGSHRWRASLIVVETAAAVVLVIAATLLIRSFAALSRVDMGFPSDRLLVAATSVPARDVAGARRAMQFYRDLLAQLSRTPGVQYAGATTALPSQSNSNGAYALEGGLTFEQMGIGTAPMALFTTVSPAYFAAMGIPVVRGRAFTDGDNDTAPFVAIVNESLARKSFPGTDPIGRRISTGYDLARGPDGTAFMRIVGVVKDVRADDPSLAPTPQIYMPMEQHPAPATASTIVVRTAGPPLQLGAAVHQMIRSLNPDVPAKISTMDEVLGVAVATPRFRTILLALFAGSALILAVAGIYGIVAFMVSQRTSELGLRMALGAQRSEIVRLTVSSGLRLTAIGLAIGWAAALALSRVLASMLFETPARDPLIFAATPALLFAVAALASAVPALRASRVDPSVALRVE